MTGETLIVVVVSVISVSENVAEIAEIVTRIGLPLTADTDPGKPGLLSNKTNLDLDQAWM